MPTGKRVVTETIVTSSKASKSSAFTLVELSVAVVVLVIIVMAIVPTGAMWLKGTERSRFRSQALALLEEGQSQAVARRSTMEVSVSGTTLTLQQPQTADGETSALIRTLSLPADTNFGQAWRKEAAEASEAFVISYYPDGTVNAGALEVNFPDGSQQVLMVNAAGKASWATAPPTEPENWDAGSLEVRSE